MNHRHIARVYLQWFEQEAEMFADPSTIVRIMSNTDYVSQYTSASTRAPCSALDFVTQLARSRLSPVDAEYVADAALTLLGVA